MLPDDALVDRFRTDLEALSAAGQRIGIAVSGGPDSVALLLLAAASRPGEVEAATVDHRFRPESRAEAEMVADICRKLDVPHSILTADWAVKPTTAIQEQARELRYRLLAGWAQQRGLRAIATGHHACDQAETILMRLNRGSGLRGLAGMRPKSIVPNSTVPLLRPLLSWSRGELARICETAGISPASDPSNNDEQFERVRVRQGLASAPWLDPSGVAQSAQHLAIADEALDWVTESLALARVTDDGEGLVVEAAGLPPELQRRLLLFAFARFSAPEPRGADLTRALRTLGDGQPTTLSGLKIDPGARWRVTPAPPRRQTRPSDNLR